MVIRQDQATCIHNKAGATAEGLGSELGLAQRLNLHDASINFGEDRARHIGGSRRCGADQLGPTVSRGSRCADWLGRWRRARDGLRRQPARCRYGAKRSAADSAGR